MNTKLFLILPLLVVLALVSCDNDSEGMAQETGTLCTCFSPEIIKFDADMGKVFSGCLVVPDRLSVSLFLAEGQTEFTFNVSCEDANFGSCECVDGARSIVSRDVTKDEYFDCASILIDAIVNEFENESMSMCIVSN